MEKFIVGQDYVRCGLFGPSFLVRCMGRTEKTVDFGEPDYDLEDLTTINIEYDGNGNEICECWEYRGHKAYLKAKQED